MRQKIFWALVWATVAVIVFFGWILWNPANADQVREWLGNNASAMFQAAPAATPTQPPSPLEPTPPPTKVVAPAKATTVPAAPAIPSPTQAAVVSTTQQISPSVGISTTNNGGVGDTPDWATE